MIAYAPPPAIVQPAPRAPASTESKFYELVARGLEAPALSLREYVPEAWRIVEPSRSFLWNWHIDAITEHLEAVWLGQITRLIINGPPRCGKSLPVSVLFPSWMWTRIPSWRLISASYAQDLATKHNTDRRDIISSEWYQARWGRTFELAGDQNLKREFENDARGHMVARGTGGGITGYGADAIIWDDGMSPLLAHSERERQAAITYYDSTLYTRLDDKAKGAIIINEQRLHPKDLTAHVLGNGEPWVHLVLPSVEPRRRVVTMPVSKRELVREEGAVLWADREPVETLAKIKTAMGSRNYGAQYLQAPEDFQGSILKRDWWLRFKSLGKVKRRIWVWDTAHKKKQENDYSVGGLVAETNLGYFLERVIRAKLEYPELRKAIKDAYASQRASAIVIEDKASGSSLVPDLKKNPNGTATGLPVVAVPAEVDKIARANLAAPTVEAGMVWIPDEAAWVSDFLDETAAFPNGDHDDQVDMIVHAINWFRAHGGASPVSVHVSRVQAPSMDRDDDDEDDTFEDDA